MPEHYVKACPLCHAPVSDQGSGYDDLYYEWSCTHEKACDNEPIEVAAFIDQTEARFATEAWLDEKWHGWAKLCEEKRTDPARGYLYRNDDLAWHPNDRRARWAKIKQGSKGVLTTAMFGSALKSVYKDSLTTFRHDINRQAFGSFAIIPMKAQPLEPMEWDTVVKGDIDVFGRLVNRTERRVRPVEAGAAIAHLIDQDSARIGGTIFDDHDEHVKLHGGFTAQLTRDRN
jgi:hypothetical protein